LLALLTLSVGPRIQSQPPVNQDGLALLEVLIDDLGGLAEGVAVDERDFLFQLPARVTPLPIDGEPELGDRGVVRGVPQLNVPRNPTAENDLVEVHGGVLTAWGW